MKTSRVRNQRVSSGSQSKKQQLLEVTVRKDKATAIRNKAILVLSLKFLLVVSLVVGCYFGGKEALRRLFWENPDYFLTDVRVSTDGALTREQILTTAGIVEGRNILAIDLSKAQEALTKLPQIDRIDIQRVMPNRINIGIIERRPIAWLTAKKEEDPSTSESAFLIDARGVVMRTKTFLPEYLHLPVISGVALENLAPGQRVQTLEMQAALELVRINADSTRFQARNIDLAKRYCLTVTDRNHACITFGLDRVDLQLGRLNRILDHLEPGRREIQTVNLLVERNTPVTFADAPIPAGEELPVVAAPKSEAPPVKTVKPVTAKATAAPVKPVAGALKPSVKPIVKSQKPSANSVRKPFRL